MIRSRLSAVIVVRIPSIASRRAATCCNEESSSKPFKSTGISVDAVLTGRGVADQNLEAAVDRRIGQPGMVECGRSAVHGEFADQFPIAVQTLAAGIDLVELVNERARQFIQLLAEAAQDLVPRSVLPRQLARSGKQR